MSDEPKPAEKWLGRCFSVLCGFCVPFAAYMGVYYATIHFDAGGGRIPYQSYRIGAAELPEHAHGIFATADWIDDHIHLAKCRKPLVAEIALPPSR
jgi:hypothetical protein